MKNWLIFAFALTTFGLANAQKWELDASHTSVQFAIDHLAISEVTGKFGGVSGAFTSPTDDFLKASGEVTIDLNTVNTDNADRDAHLKGPDFFDTAKFPKLVYKAERFRKSGDKYVVEGKLTLHGVTKPVQLEGKFSGVTKDPWGNTRAGFMRFSGAIDRKDYGLTWSKTLESGGLLVGDEVRLTITTELIKK